MGATNDGAQNPAAGGDTHPRRYEVASILSLSFLVTVLDTNFRKA